MTYVTLNESAGFRTQWILQLTCCFSMLVQFLLHTFCSLSVSCGKYDIGSLFIFMYGLAVPRCRDLSPMMRQLVADEVGGIWKEERPLFGVIPYNFHGVADIHNL